MVNAGMVRRIREVIRSLTGGRKPSPTRKPTYAVTGFERVSSLASRKVKP